MRILYIATSFPEPHRGATIYTDLAEELYNAGHDIVVAVTEQTRNKNKTEMKRERGFEVLRIVIGNYFDVGYLQKGLTTLKIPSLMKKGIEKYLSSHEFDFILFEAPPVTNAGLVAWAKKKFKCPAYLMLKDIFPQNAADLNIIKQNGLIYKYFALKEMKLLKTADYIGCMSPANKNYVITNNPWLDKKKVELFPNTKKLTDKEESNRYILREKYGIPGDACVFLFGGNMGRPQYIELLSNAVKACKNDKSIFFLFIGRGTDRYKLKNTITENDIKNAVVIENLPRDNYEQIMKECNVGLIVLDPRFTIPNFPSRILSYMEFSKPILAATDQVTDLKELIKEAECGEWVWSQDTDAFIAKIREMAASDSLEIMGENGRKYIEENFNVKRSVEILEKHFN
ncbi:glycosyltransferase family 4 protein [Bacillus sp. JJ1609]|uniref:glycosyltransferase family 4 protein n=1 Tax=Bacillus sp. JJ1609 TaxID=3122977 RepID=UPI002FFF4700